MFASMEYVLVNVTSQFPRLYLELRKILDVSETFLDRSLSLLLLFLRQVLLFRTTSSNGCARDSLHVAVLALDPL